MTGPLSERLWALADTIRRSSVRTLATDAAALEAQNARLTAAVEAVRTLHSEDTVDLIYSEREPAETITVCVECDVDSPCPTIRALGEAGDGA